MRWSTRIKELASLDVNHQVFGARGRFGHAYRAQRVAVDELVEFERWCGRTLPEEFRDYILEVGTGVGPDYGIYSLQRMREELDEIYNEYFEQSQVTGKPCDDFELEAQLLALRKANHAGFEPIPSPSFPGGFIPISEGGCGGVTVLVTSGALRGVVFDHNHYGSTHGEWFPATRPTSLIRFVRQTPALPEFDHWPTFGEWVDGWLDQALRDFHGPGPMMFLA